MAATQKQPVQKQQAPPANPAEGKPATDGNKKDTKDSKKDGKMKKPRKKKEMNIWVKDIFLAVINIGFIIGLVVLLTRIPTRAKQVKTLRSQSLVKQDPGQTNLQTFELENNKESIDQLKVLFPDEEGLLLFVDEVEALKENGTVERFTFESKNPVKDKTGFVGLPISIEMVGSWEALDTDIQKMQELPFMFRPLTFDAEEVPEEGAVYLKYGGILYVDKSLEKN